MSKQTKILMTNPKYCICLSNSAIVHGNYSIFDSKELKLYLKLKILEQIQWFWW